MQFLSKTNCMIAVIVVFLSLIPTSVCLAQLSGIRYFSSIPSAAGKTSISTAQLSFHPALHSNPEKDILSINIAPARFGLKDLSPALLLCDFNIGKGIYLGGSIFGIGNELYNEFNASAITSVRLTEFFTIGSSLGLSRLGIKDYNNEFAFDLNIGGSYYIIDIVSIGFTLRNLTGAYYSGGSHSIKRIADIGIGLSPLPDLSFDIDAVIDISNSPGVAIAAKYAFPDVLAFRLAILTNPGSIEGGTSIKVLSFMSLNANINYHEYLGFSQWGGLCIEW